MTLWLEILDFNGIDVARQEVAGGGYRRRLADCFAECHERMGKSAEAADDVRDANAMGADPQVVKILHQRSFVQDFIDANAVDVLKIHAMYIKRMICLGYSIVAVTTVVYENII